MKSEGLHKYIFIYLWNPYVYCILCVLAIQYMTFLFRIYMRIVWFLWSPPVQVIKRNMTGVWVASTAWALNDGVSSLPGINTIGTVLAFADITRPLDLFTPYVRELFTKIEKERQALSLLQSGTPISPLDNPCPACSQVTRTNASMVEINLVQRSAFSVYTAVYCVAHALHDLLGCNANNCAVDPRTQKVYPWQVILL